MWKRIVTCLSILILSVGTGCGAADRADLDKVKADLEKLKAELEKVKAELAEARAELKLLKSEKKPGYLDELERLEALRAKGVLTKEEFEAKKKTALGAAPRPDPVSSSMDELARQLRTIQALYSNNTINNLERDQKKQQLINGPLTLTDLKKDLETVQALYSENVINNVERDALKRRLLEMEPIKK